MFDDLTYDEMEAIIGEMVKNNVALYDLYVALSREQLRRLVEELEIA